MGVLLLAAAGGAIGYMAWAVLGYRRHMLLNIAMGMLGSLLATLVLIPYFGMPVLFGGDISVASFFVALIGSVVTVGGLNLSILRVRT
ncbi:hypothetical protein [uncultured Salinicola sp.]|uniref:hypothetical protein n=1 Tax=uncultured Salinicola sp. TaxID=1193542 RepID=UPI002605D523|nr:hypothetical protein [uncultured Salinicola sp.]|tara:strand:- start:1355 stop:1618 length:264 start_codon:yes stop_codon:yes gene_type:complete